MNTEDKLFNMLGKKHRTNTMDTLYDILGKKQTLHNCHDCGVKPGQLHKKGCDMGPINKRPARWRGY